MADNNKFVKDLYSGNDYKLWDNAKTYPIKDSGDYNHSDCRKTTEGFKIYYSSTHEEELQMIRGYDSRCFDVST